MQVTPEQPVKTGHCPILPHLSLFDIQNVTTKHYIPVSWESIIIYTHKQNQLVTISAFFNF